MIRSSINIKPKILVLFYSQDTFCHRRFELKVATEVVERS